MHMLPIHRWSAVVALGAAIGLIAACTTDPEAPTTTVEPSASLSAHGAHGSGNDGKLTSSQLQAIARVRQATAKFHDIEAAKAAGYTNQYPPGCAVSPEGEGAQAFHYLNPGLVDATVELLRPELVMYEPQRDGSLQLIGVDYVVPFDVWKSSEPPTLLGVPFMRNEPLGVWALHIWAWRPNPSGMFAAWNPKVSCQHASAVSAAVQP